MMTTDFEIAIEGMIDESALAGLRANTEFRANFSIDSSIAREGQFRISQAASFQLDGVEFDDYQVSVEPELNRVVIEAVYDQFRDLIPGSSGDLDHDGRVGFSDFLMLSDTFGDSVQPGIGADIDADGMVGFGDFLVLSSHYGLPSPLFPGSSFRATINFVPGMLAGSELSNIPTGELDLRQVNSSQQWVLNEVDTGIFTIQHAVNGHYLEAYVDEFDDYRAITSQVANVGDLQHWRLTNIGNDTYTIQHVVNDRYLDAYEDSGNDFTAVTRDFQGNDSQKWILRKLESGTYTIQHGVNFRYLDAHESLENDFRAVTRDPQLTGDFTGLLEIQDEIGAPHMVGTIRTLSVSDPNSDLSMPENNIALDSGSWGPDTVIDAHVFNQTAAAPWSNHYDDCVGKELFHPQHVVRLPNKNGRAYFMVSQSRAHNGYISVLETDLGAVDPATDLLVSLDNRGTTGRYIWQDVYTGERNGTFNPIGNWNHPGKMSVVGGVLVVAAQNWDEANPFCQYAPGTSMDAVLFYDVRDPESPRYMGAITANDLGVDEVANLELIRTPDDQYLLQAGGGDSKTTWIAPQLNPQQLTTTWTRVSGSEGLAHQHGAAFTSYQWKTTISEEFSPPAGTERILFFDTSADDGRVVFLDEYVGRDESLVRAARREFDVDLPGAERHWNTASLYITEYGSPVMYSVQSEEGSDYVLYQGFNPDDIISSPFFI